MEADALVEAAAGAFWGCLAGPGRLGPLGAKAAPSLAARVAHWSCSLAAATLRQGGAALVWAESSRMEHRAWLDDNGPCEALLQAPHCERMWFDACMFGAASRRRSLLLGWATSMFWAARALTLHMM